MTRRALPIALGVGLLGIGAVAIAKPDGARGPGGAKGGPCAMLECTDDQRSELQAAFKEAREDNKADREAIKRLRGKLAAEWVKDAPDEAAMKKLEAEIRTHHAAMADRMHDAMMEVHGILDAEQRTKMAEAMEKRGGLFGGRQGGRHKGPRGKGPRADGPQ